MSGIVSAVVVAAAAAYSAYSASTAKAPSVDTSAASGEVNNAANNVASQRTQLLETAGGSEGQSLNTNQVSNSKTIFGN